MAMMIGNYTLLMVVTNMNGFACLAQYSVAYEMSVYIADHLKVGEATIGGLINMISNGLGFFIVLGLTPFLNKGLPIDS